MKINKLIVNNFFRFYDKQEIIFSNNPERNVTVVRGENGAGKTTLLNAFYWGMYGDVLPPLAIESMLNYRKAEELEENHIDSAYIKLEFEDKDRKYTIIRKQRFIKKDGSVRSLGVEKPYITYTDNRTGNEIEVEEANFMESIIPKRLRHFFFFDGERINQLAQVDGKKDIQNAILDILGLSTINNTKKDLMAVKTEYNRELLNNTDKDEQKYIKDRIKNEEYIELANEVLENLEKDMADANQILDGIEKFLLQNNSEIVRSKQNERARLERDLTKKNNELNEVKQRIINLTSKDLKTAIMKEVFDDVLEYLEEKREKGELPSDIKAQFIDDLLEKGRCICGCNLEKGSEHYRIVEALKQIAGRTELDDAYSKITSYIKQVNSEEDFFKRYNLLVEKENYIEGEIDSLKYNIDKIGKELENSDEEQISYHENKRREMKYKITEISNKIGKTQNEIRIAEREVKKADEKIRGAKLTNKLAERTQRRIAQVEKILELNREIEQYFIDTTRIELDNNIKKVYGKITRKDYRVPVLTEDFELKITSTLKNDKFDNAEVLSTGEGQITSLSFIGALVEYSRQKTKETFISDFAGGDFPIVMDSPFGNLDATHTANVAANIGELASQVVIVVSDKQWSKEVKENLGHQVGAMYKMNDENDVNKNIGECTVIKEERYFG